MSKFKPGDRVRYTGTTRRHSGPFVVIGPHPLSDGTTVVLIEGTGAFDFYRTKSLELLPASEEAATTPTIPVSDPVDGAAAQTTLACPLDKVAYSVDETLTILGIGRTAFYSELINTGRLRTVEVGRRRLVPRSSILELLGIDP